MRKLLVTGLGTGYLPVAPGTWGSLAVALIYLLTWRLGYWPQFALLMGVTVLASAACVALGDFAERTFGKKDPGQVTIDEWAGQALTYLLIPLPQDWSGAVLIAAAGFLLFRVFDIVKPPPAQQIQRVSKGWGILLDDLIAGVYANIILQLLARFALPHLLRS